MAHNSSGDETGLASKHDQIMEVLLRIESYLTGLPSSAEFKTQWDVQKEIFVKSNEGWALEAESRNLLRTHIEDMKSLKELQFSAIKQTENLVTAQDRLATNLNNINENLEKGFKLGASVVSLFGKIVFVFFASLIVLCLVIVWIARLDITYKDGEGSVSHGQRTHKEQPASIP